jgi:uncharacterized protein YggE
MSPKTLLACTLLVSCPVLTPRTAAAAEPEKRTVNVSAMAEVKVAPDQVVFTLGITTQDQESLAGAKAANDQKTRAVLAVLQKNGVPKENIQVSSIQMGPVYKKRFAQDAGRQRVIEERQVDYYYVTREIEVVLTQFEAVERTIDGAVAAGASHVGDLLFRTTKNREKQVEARRKAVEYAKEKASHLATLNGLKLGKALKIEEDVESSLHTTGWGEARTNVMAGDSASLRTPKPWANIHLTAGGAKPPGATRAKAEDAGAGELLPPGIIVISATVTITFEMVE